ncbi:hypothetical protein Pse7367_1404 [Thalassoporum mexicanum PCC 7367]|nr:hypothetical protein Pse7367_1404 [Pseudanabaena sp. PCC 7367]
MSDKSEEQETNPNKDSSDEENEVVAVPEVIQRQVESELPKKLDSLWGLQFQISLMSHLLLVK